VDGKEVLRARPGEPTAETGVSLVRGDHQIFLEAVLARVGDSARLEWKSVTRSHPKSGDESGWQSIPTARLQPTDRPTRGLFGTIEVPARPRQYRLDPTIATGSLCQELEYCESFEAVWRGSLEIPRSGVYRMGLRAEGGSAELRLDGRPVVQSDGAGSELVEREVQLEAGSRAVELAFHPRRGPAALEWVWAPPGGEASIVPPSALSPPPGVAVGSPLPLEVLDPLEGRPADRPLTIVP
jgi:hypothetical protein